MYGSSTFKALGESPVSPHPWAIPQAELLKLRTRNEELEREKEDLDLRGDGRLGWMGILLFLLLWEI